MIHCSVSVSPKLCRINNGRLIFWHQIGHILLILKRGAGMPEAYSEKQFQLSRKGFKSYNHAKILHVHVVSGWFGIKLL
jgi:hypothetical protein